ncbi:MAG: FIG01126328: hypothetical protein [uncultured Solirubrobacterales bacterium]|uniref:DUF4188 domain-containing protein n=1 Tax=uncultured Solirubrobacterales bacterium TaxID=768556 RepID=A0A6J4T902_9ACTN|nr:MAG: FIG01126328: hypothetical protein [uncultured Solirubrobacterales bacterium]
MSTGPDDESPHLKAPSAFTKGVHPGRYSARVEGDFVVFLIGMRINRPLRVDRWLPVFRAMPRMVRELEGHPESGFLGTTWAWSIPAPPSRSPESERRPGATGPLLVQYWRSFDDLERYARNPDAEHLPAWRRFNQEVRASGDVGIWHETYRVRAGEYEAVYGNMPRVGLAGIGEHVPAGSSSTAARRIGARADDTAPVAGY